MPSDRARREFSMITAFFLVMLGIIGLIAGGIMFGDLGIAAMIGAGAALLSGSGLFCLTKRVAELEAKSERINK